MNENKGHTATLVNSDALCVSFDPPGFRHTKDNTISYCFTLFIFGRPCHFSSVSLTLKNNLFIQLWRR